MRVSALVVALALASGYYVCSRAGLGAASTSGVARAGTFAATPSSAAESKKLDFAADIRPIFESRCTPCHFAGGQMYERLPFDRPETIRKLGAKLFPRIKDENEQRVLREFLAQQ
jgi:hypothetical protein